MREGYIFSGILHGIILLMVLLGLPDWFKAKLPEQQPIAVQLVNVSDLTRALKRNPHPIQEAKLDTPPPDRPSKAPPPPKPDPLAPPPPPPAAATRNPDDESDDETPPPPEKQPPPPKPTPAPPPVVPKPVKAPPPPKPKPTPPKQQAKVTPPKKVKEVVKPKPVKKKAPKANQDLDFDSLLKNLSNDAKTIEKNDQPPRRTTSAPPPQEASAQPDAPLGDQLSTSELDALRAQIEKCWNPPAGGKDEDKIVVPIKLVINQDGTVASAQVVDSYGYYNTNQLWQAVADSALRAVESPNCSPLKLPSDKFDQWKLTTLNFSPQDLQ